MRRYGNKSVTIFSAIPALLVVALFFLNAGVVRASDILNQAAAQYTVPSSGDTLNIASGTVRVSITLPPPVIHFYRNNNFTNFAAVTRLGNPLYIQATASSCNLDPNVAETHQIILTSGKTGDREIYDATETAPNSGLFRIMMPVPTEDATVHRVIIGDGTLQTVRNDSLTATIEGCGAASTQAIILIDPDGIVFDSKTGAPIPGAKVTIYDATTGNPALVFDFDGFTPAPNSVITDAAGHYQFPVVDPGKYFIKVVPPVGYTTPSKVPVSKLPPGRNIDPSGSYEGNFEVTLLGGNVHIDIPADNHVDPGQGLFVQKAASRTEGEIGDFVEYSVDVKNVSGGTLTNVRLVDYLPAGFFYKNGSAKLAGVSIPDPVFKGSSRFEVIIPSILDATVVTLTYRVQIGPGALQGDGVNRAQAFAAGPPKLASNVATAKVKLVQGVFTDKSVVIGKIFVDINHNRIQDAGEPGIPGVRLYIEDGTYVISDSEGKYSIYGLAPKAHVMKVDPTTLPRGSKLEVLSTRNAEYSDTVFLDLKRYEMHKANFAEGTASKEVLDEVKRRAAKGEVVTAELDRTLKDQLSPDGAIIVPPDPRGLPASGIVGTAATQAAPTQPEAPKKVEKTNAPVSFTPVLPEGTLNSGNSVLPSFNDPSLPYARLENTITNLDNKLGFIDLKDKDTLPIAQTTIRVKGNSAGKITLKVNGEEVSKSFLGKRVENAAKQIQALEYVGIGLKPGANTLELSVTDPFGNVRGTETIHVTAPDKLAVVKIVLPKHDQPADGNTPAKITVLLQDEHGVPVTARTPLTLESTVGRWNVEDLDKREPGIQVFIEGGKAVFELLPPDVAADAMIGVSSGIIQTRAKLAFLPDLRPMLAVGIVEGTLRLNSLSFSHMMAARSDDGFEEELRNLSANSDDGKLNAAARTAFFLKGKLKGEYLLTAGFDSSKQKERLFRDIQPDEFYPVYGDSSVRGFDAQSSGKLYVRIDKKRCYLLYGDFTTSASSTDVRGLGNYNRSLTGVREHYEKNRISANIWASQDSTRQVIEELPANGTSGPFFFNIHNALVGSETIEILVRDRNQPSLIISNTPMARFEDYEFEPFTGRVLFKRPIPSLDGKLNPISVRATFEVDQGGDKFWVYGGDAQVKINNHWEVGAAAVHDENPMLRYDLRSANTTVKLTEKTYAIAEVAQSDNELSGVGSAGRVEVRHASGRTDARVYMGKTEANFTNSASIMQPGRVEGGFKVTERLDKGFSLVTEGIWTEEEATSGSRKGVRGDVIKNWGNYSLDLGARHSQETANPANNSTVGVTPNEVNSLRAKFSMPVPKLPSASVYAEYENDVKQTDNRMVAVGGDWRVRSKTKLYARHEFISSIGGPYELNGSQQQNTTVVGLETEYMKNGNLFNEYRARDAFEGREAEASTGLRNLWNVAEGVRLNTTLERVTPVVNGKENEATAVTGAIEYTRNPESKTTARLELRNATTADSLLNSFGYARKVSRDWTFLGKTILLMQANKGPGAGDKQQGRLQAGMAYRQTETDKWNALFKYEYKYENDESTKASPMERQANIFMSDLNYQPTADLIFNLHYAMKVAFETTTAHDDTAIAHLVGTRVTYDLTKRWDIGFNANTLFDAGFAHQQFAIGPEVGFIVKRNLRIAVGYNVTGFRDRDLDDGYTNQGLFVNLRLKFDETLFKRKEDNE